jgi:hypothetical protein
MMKTRKHFPLRNSLDFLSYDLNRGLLIPQGHDPIPVLGQEVLRLSTTSLFHSHAPDKSTASCSCDEYRFSRQKEGTGSLIHRAASDVIEGFDVHSSISPE